MSTTEIDATSIDNNDELSYFSNPSLPWANSIEALRGCRADDLEKRYEKREKRKILLEVSLILLFHLVTRDVTIMCA